MFEISILISLAVITYVVYLLVKLYNNEVNKYGIPMTSAHYSQPPKLEWWAFLIMAFSLFAVILLINFFVKKVNDAKIEERYKLMYARCNNQGTQVNDSLDLGHRDQKHRPASLSFVYEKKDNLEIMLKDNVTKSGSNLNHDRYVSDWMVVYGRNKSNGNNGQEGNRSKRNSKDTHSTVVERENENTWLTAIINDLINTAVAFKENVASLSK